MLLRVFLRQSAEAPGRVNDRDGVAASLTRLGRRARRAPQKPHPPGTRRQRSVRRPEEQIRPIDNFEGSKINAACGAQEKVQIDGVDQIVQAVLTLLSHGLPTQPGDRLQTTGRPPRPQAFRVGVKIEMLNLYLAKSLK